MIGQFIIALLDKTKKGSQCIVTISDWLEFVFVHFRNIYADNLKPLFGINENIRKDK